MMKPVATMATKIKRGLIYLIIISFITGCNARLQQANFTPTKILETRPVQTISKDVKKDVPTAISTETPSQNPYLQITPFPVAPNKPLGKEMQVKCLTVLSVNELIDNSNVNGNIVAGIDREELHYYLKNLQTGEENLLLANIYENEYPAISPNGKWVIYREQQKTGIVIKTIEPVITPVANPNQTNEKRHWVLRGYNGNEKVLKNYPEEWTNPRWLNNNQIVFEIHPKYPFDLMVVNPFSDERRELKTNFPSTEFIVDKEPSWYRFMYNANLTRAVVPSKTGGEEYQLTDLGTKRILMKFTGGDNYYLPIPQWNPDGSKFALAGGVPMEYYSIDVWGKLNRLTNFNEYYPGKYQLSWTKYSWSPDGRYLAGSINISPEFKVLGQNSQLVLIDTVSKITSLFCMPTRGSNVFGENSGLVWSPDGKKIILIDNWEAAKTRIYLVDLEKEKAYQFGEEYRIVFGWMVKK